MAQIPGSPRVCQYTASLGQTVFIYDYKIYEDDEIKVQLGDTTLTLTTDYTVQDAGETVGGTITLVTGTALGAVLTLTGNSMIERDTTFIDGGDYLASAINGEYNKLDNITKEIVTAETSYMKLAKYSPGISVIVPDPVASKCLKWNAAEDALELSVYDPDAGSASAAAAAISAAAALVSENNAAASEADAAISATDAAASAASIDLTDLGSDIIPDEDDHRLLGTSSKRWNEIHTTYMAAEHLTISENLTGLNIDCEEALSSQSGWFLGNVQIDGNLTVDGNLIGNVPDEAFFQTQFASGIGGGTYTTTIWMTRPINTTIYNNISGCSLGSSQVTLAAGAYFFYCSAESFDTNVTLYSLYNTTDSVDIIRWNGGYNGGNTSNPAGCTAQFTLAAQKVLEVRMIADKTEAINGMGYPGTLGVNNIFLTAVFRKLL